MPSTTPAEPSAAKRARTTPADAISDAVVTNGGPEYIYCFECLLGGEDEVLIGRSKDPNSELKKRNSTKEIWGDGGCTETLNPERDLKLLYERFQFIRTRNYDDCFDMSSVSAREYFRDIIDPLFIYESEQRAAAAAVATDAVV